MSVCSKISARKTSGLPVPIDALFVAFDDGGFAVQQAVQVGEAFAGGHEEDFGADLAFEEGRKDVDGTFRVSQHVVGFRQAVFMAFDQLRQAGMEAVERRSEEHTSELHSLMRISYAVF